MLAWGCQRNLRAWPISYIHHKYSIMRGLWGTIGVPDPVCYSNLELQTKQKVAVFEPSSILQLRGLGKSKPKARPSAPGREIPTPPEFISYGKRANRLLASGACSNYWL